MTKKEASIIINKDLNENRLKPFGNGNVKWANKSKGIKNVYWINVHKDERLKNEFHFILNDEDKQILTHLIIPPETFLKTKYPERLDKTNDKMKIDIELSYDNFNYLKDIKSGGPKLNFLKYVSKTYNY